MLTNLKRILLAQYIGAIITAFIAAQGILSLIGVAELVVSVWLQPRETSVFGGATSRAGLDWNTVLIQLIRVALHFAVAGGFLWWLYVEKPDTTQLEAAEPELGEGPPPGVA